MVPKDVQSAVDDLRRLQATIPSMIANEITIGTHHHVMDMTIDKSSIRIVIHGFMPCSG